MKNFSKACLLDIYRRGTTPYRTWLMRSLIARGQAPLLVFFYHRVGDHDQVPWSLSNRQFSAHIHWLKQRFEMISLQEMQKRIRSGVNRQPAVHITFDDGYAENCDFALPMLVREEVPCTYFVTLDNILTGRSFEHDLRAGKRFPVNTMGQLREMLAAGIEIGAHTRTHPNLGEVQDPATLHDEIVVARDELQNRLGHPVRYFAFPFGMPANLNSDGFHLARQAGMQAAVSAYGGYNFPGEDAFHLQRLHGDPPLSRIKNLATLDPRKLKLPRFDYAATPSAEMREFLERAAENLPGTVPYDVLRKEAEASLSSTGSGFSDA